MRHLDGLGMDTRTHNMISLPHGLLSDGHSMWQARFWEHTVRDDEDYARCADYIHYNPVTHGLVTSTRDWPYSTFRQYVERGIYQPDWGEGKEVAVAGSEYDE